MEENLALRVLRAIYQRRPEFLGEIAAVAGEALDGDEELGRLLVSLLEIRRDPPKAIPAETRTLPHRQGEVLRFIKDHRKTHGRSPTWKEMMEGCKFGSMSEVGVVLAALERKELIRRGGRGNAAAIEVR